MSVIPMVAGAMVAGRFEIERAASSGGMGTVFRARDQRTGQPVALKLLHPVLASGQDATRLMIESQFLAELRHPHIVSYIAHGHTPSGHPFLAMEWLEGEDLSQRLQRQPLMLRESLLLIRGAAEGLAAAHRHGIVHRDIKPSNLFLPDGDPARVMLLDFGVARQQKRAMSLTRTGAMIGTPGYMAPEQARGLRNIGPSADIFSLGCVFLECLTGQPPFVAPHFAALLSRILFDEAPSVVSLRPEVPQPISELVARMLRKDPQQRPPDGRALLVELDAIALRQDFATLAPRPGVGLAPFSSEQGLLSVILASHRHPPQARSRTASETDTQDEGPPFAALLGSDLSALGASVEWLPEQMLLASLTPLDTAPRATAQDCAIQAARCALRVHEHWPQSLVAVATGRGVSTGSVLGGEVIERVRQFLDVHVAADATPREATRGVVLDEVTARLVEARFEMTRAGPGLYRLDPQHERCDEPRPLLDGPAPFVGRGHEMGVLRSVLRECQSESLARVVQVTAPPGLGKSRLRLELTQELRASGQRFTLIGACAALGTERRGGLLGDAIRRLCGVTDGENRAAAGRKFEQRLASRLVGAEHAQGAATLRWLCGLGTAADRELLPADPLQAPGPALSRGLVRWLDAECRQQPVLVILDDLQWADVQSIELIEHALRELPDRPLMVLALGRPELAERFPQLWSDCRCVELSLPGLARAACEKLVYTVLGPAAPPPLVEQIRVRAGGSPLYLEELVRAVAERRGDSVPETLLAMVQADLQRLPPLARRVLRAASIFGPSFRIAGVLHLLGREPSLSSDDLERCLQALVEAHILSPQRTAFSDPDSAFQFRQRLVQEALYQLLLPAERALGHRAALAFLLESGEPDAQILDEHARRAGDRSVAS
ncbi:MAG: protein kinase [Polyangia bacterium]